eukprot:m.246727 g.246727  ORF g.246727 m.246727 type:complete len:356 (-) comp10968_c3_seq19:786-1853(-)
MARRRAGSTTWSTRLVLKELEEPHASRGTTTDRISLPAACLEALGGAISPDRDPLTVRIALRRTPGAPTVCAGISDFGAPEGTVAIPPWMAAQLKATPGAFLHIQRVDLPRADSCVFRAVDPSFFALRDQRAVLEQALSTQYTTLTKGTTIATWRLWSSSQRMHASSSTLVRPLSWPERVQLLAAWLECGRRCSGLLKKIVVGMDSRTRQAHPHARATLSACRDRKECSCWPRGIGLQCWRRCCRCLERHSHRSFGLGSETCRDPAAQPTHWRPGCRWCMSQPGSVHLVPCGYSAAAVAPQQLPTAYQPWCNESKRAPLTNTARQPREKGAELIRRNGLEALLGGMRRDDGHHTP